MKEYILKVQDDQDTIQHQELVNVNTQMILCNKCTYTMNRWGYSGWILAIFKFDALWFASINDMDKEHGMVCANDPLAIQSNTYLSSS